MAGQYYDSESSLFYNWNRYYNPAVGRYISSDPIGLAGGLNTFGYVGQNPVMWIDPRGLDLLVILGAQRPDSYNVFGHVGIAVTGAGIFSFGNDTPLGSSTTDYLTAQSQLRLQEVFRIPTTPEQDAAALEYLRQFTDKNGVDKIDNCANRAYSALVAAGVPVRLQGPGVYIPRDIENLMIALQKAGLATQTVIPLAPKSIPDFSSFDPQEPKQ